LNPEFSLERMPEVFVAGGPLSPFVSRETLRGTLRRLAPRVYTRNLRDPPEQIVQRHLWQLVSQLIPGAVIADRTALESRPGRDGSIFVVADRKRDIELPGVIVRPRRGPPALAGSDTAFIGGLFWSSEARACLDNLAPSRQRADRVARTLSRAELELRLEDKIRSHGADALNRLRDVARQIAPQLGREAELAALETLISALLGTHDAPLDTPRGRARQAGTPFDPGRIALFERLYHELRVETPALRVAADRDAEGRATLAFFEAYFSNFIEGTKFTVDEAADIVFQNQIPRARPEDAHDVAGTWRVVSDPIEMARTPADPDQLLELLRRRHATLMAARPEKHPGVFKVEVNQAGSTVFVAPELALGTLIQGLDLYRGLTTPFARAVYMMFLIAEVHPFTDGNGRTARIMMNAELVSAGEERIVIPTVLRDDYIAALKALSRAANPRPLVRTLGFAQRWVAAVPWGALATTTTVLTDCHAFLESADAERDGVALRMPDR
jgi:hypothetical protein